MKKVVKWHVHRVISNYECTLIELHGTKHNGGRCSKVIPLGVDIYVDFNPADYPTDKSTVFELK